MTAKREADLYPAIKALFEDRGYVVKSEVGAADVVAMRGGEPPVVIELKLSLSLALFHQAVARQSVTDDVYIAVEHRSGKRFVKSVKQSVMLARRLGIGLMTVRLGDGSVSVYCDPGPFQPRKSKKRQFALVGEFNRRVGDPNTGGQARQGLVTAYRQDAVKIALYLFEVGATRGADVAKATGVEKATRLMRDNYYGWFEKVAVGVYGLTPDGAQAAADASTVLGR
ncbi:MAG: DUF2161 family putative PD-(D/E)XK-type phosphodiesterase [Roseobacter sp.]